MDLYGIRWFKDALLDFFEDNPPENPATELEISEDDRITVYPKATQIIHDDTVVGTGIVDIIHASPQSTLTRLSPSGGGRQGSKFDTVLIPKAPPTMGQQTYGMDGEFCGMAWSNFCIC